MDTLARTKKLEALGFDRPRAEGLVQMVKQSIDEEVAKKVDLRELGADLKSDISEVRLEIGQLRTELKQDIADLRTELKQDIADLRTELKQDIAEVRIEIGQVKTELKLDFANLKAEVGELKGSVKALDEKVEKFASHLNGKIENMGRDLHFKLGRLMIALFTVFLAALVFIEPLKKRLGVDQHSIQKNDEASKVIKPRAKP